MWTAYHFANKYDSQKEPLNSGGKIAGRKSFEADEIIAVDMLRCTVVSSMETREKLKSRTSHFTHSAQRGVFLKKLRLKNVLN